MIISMTGFGRGEASANGITVTIEFKTVNSRYLDISLRLPQFLQEKELLLKEKIQQHINRGKVSTSVHIDQSRTGEPDITFDPSLVKGYKKMLDELRETAQISQPVNLEDLMHFNEIFVSRKQNEETINLIWDLTLQAADSALKNLHDMRIQEGHQLHKDLKERAEQIYQLLEKIEDLSKDRAPELREKLLERVQKLIDDDKIDPDRLETEVVLLVDKMDVTEEIVRLQSHIKFFHEALNLDNSVGRRLNFLAQEMNREINTIGSKAGSSEISQYVVQAKENLEQIREQVQNVE